MSIQTELEQTLRGHGYSSTISRRQVFQALQGQEPLTMAELIARCPGVDRASVYRATALFERLGIIVRLQTGWKYKLELSDAFHGHHHHATCLACAASYVIPENPNLERQFKLLARQLEFQLLRHQLELQGYCKACQQK